jgi:NADH dehydrogenase/NADH:ubiquinone oxidoreductase subunit G
MPELEIDGAAVRVEQGMTVLDAARKAGVEIPTLCYHEALAPYGACRLCLVEIERKERTGSGRLFTSCTCLAEEGMIVRSRSERVRKGRRVVIGLLLARCPDSELMKRLAQEYGVVPGSDDPTAAYLAERASRAVPTNCFLCGLCVRACAEVSCRRAIGFRGRGPRRVVTTPFGQVSDPCIGCGACSYLCPAQTIAVEAAE